MLLPEEVGISDFAISHFTNLKKEIHEISFPNLTPSNHSYLADNKKRLNGAKSYAKNRKLGDSIFS